jgi:hypothetical protein
MPMPLKNYVYQLRTNSPLWSKWQLNFLITSQKSNLADTQKPKLGDKVIMINHFLEDTLTLMKWHLKAIKMQLKWR